MHSSKLIIAVLLMVIASCVVVSSRSLPYRGQSIVDFINSLQLDEENEELADTFSFDSGDDIASEAIRRYGRVATAGGHCARAVRESIEGALDISLQRTESAKNYGPSLLAAGFQVVSGPAQDGDVAIFQAIPNHPHGHIQIKTPIGWVSDFKQRDQYPGPSYRSISAPFKLYRYTD
ncbi:predicted protein [Naegleria gruberi]|uniref:Predicted protein n=1 Tax=Naegleria gruberi TaxID=5762 RepID=D2VH15_NAEGR|nr:uncharacterized protein NAEGRDRAFT_68243 [Naegleria gruberi]EFC43810.1 predicted protein [Naegleria gruberi]|eukprot:XP_002676554.1 predicted protein [Naegleria gruberi strain NEG-M]